MKKFLNYFYRIDFTWMQSSMDEKTEKELSNRYKSPRGLE